MKCCNKGAVLVGFLLALTIVPSLILAAPQTEETKKFTCFADSYIDSTNENSNYGSADLKISFYSTFDWYEITFLAFEVSDLPSNAVVTTAKMEISVKYLPVDEHSTTFGIWECGEFGEYTITWLNKPSLDADDTVFVCKGTIAENTRWAFTLSDTATGGYEAHTVRGNGKYYFMLMTTTDNMWALTLDSRDDTWNPPKLAVTYTYVVTTSPASYIYDNNYDFSPLSSLLALFIIFGIPIGIVGLLYYNKRKRTEIAPISPITPKPPLTSLICPNCNTGITIGEFCEKCGVKGVIKSPTIPQLCNTCGEPLKGGRFCKKCGMKISD